MSIYASLAAPDDEEHEDDCAIWEKDGDIWDRSDRRCNCGQPNAPLVYQGSHVLPSEDDPRGGHVDIACIPAHVRYYRENERGTDEPEGVEPFLRFGVNGETVVLTETNVRQVMKTLTEWLNELEGK